MTEDSDFRPKDYLATCGMSFGIGVDEDQAILNALRYAGPFDDRKDEHVEVAVWHLYADSWETHDLSGPERDADQISFKRYQLPVEEASDASGWASEAYAALGTAKHEGETVQEEHSSPADEE